MRTKRVVSLLAAGVLVLLFTPALRATPPAQALAKASAAYYAALVASDRGNTDATNRQLLLLASHWDAALREARALVPEALKQDPAWGAALEQATALLHKARDLARARDIPGVHANLEEMRLVLHEVREQHNLWSFDDYLAQYHEAVERLTGHVSRRSEINFTAKDYQDAQEDLRAAQDAWAAVARTAGALGSHAAWQQPARETTTALRDLSGALSTRDRATVARAGERLKSGYLELLSAIAKARS